MFATISRYRNFAARRRAIGLLICFSSVLRNHAGFSEDLFVFTFLIALYLLGWLPMTVFTILHLRGGIDFSYNRSVRATRVERRTLSGAR